MTAGFQRRGIDTFQSAALTLCYIMEPYRTVQPDQCALNVSTMVSSVLFSPEGGTKRQFTRLHN